ncbi:kinase domain [Cordyceps militaris]|uniref:Kinase domain n=1 Tax=Cordyceps militaris TaxID=73501 RepID=A0A2H4ST93_CORMI|nr:kinase domain [Cordyceps militaris]
MKAINLISLLASGSLVWAADVDRRAAEEECGALGVMEAPAAAYLNGGTVRKCRDHPMGSNRGFDMSDTVANAPFQQPERRDSRRDTKPIPDALAKRCERTAGWGCGNGGYCWKNCGRNGEWCWTAADDGNGPWARCNTWKDCGWDHLSLVVNWVSIETRPVQTELIHVLDVIMKLQYLPVRRCRELFPRSILLSRSPPCGLRWFRINATHVPSSRRHMSKPASQSSDISKPSGPDTDIRFHAIDEVESMYRYGPGGYRPMAIGERLAGRYHVLNKLGHGSYSTVWLARDEAVQRLVAVKVCTADANLREPEILGFLGDLPEADSNVGAWGQALIPALLDRFCIDGPNGTHTCLVSEPTRASLADAVYIGCNLPLPLPVARAIAAQIILAVAHLHDNGVVHGDLHLGNVLFKLPGKCHTWSDEELLASCGEPEEVKVIAFDNKPIPAGVPLVGNVPIWWPMSRVRKLSLVEAHIVLADFGESYRPSQETRLECHAPAPCCPPEARFEPTQPKSFPSDIWSLGCAVWSTLAFPLFDSFMCDEDTVTKNQVETLGKLPDEWWKRWDARVGAFTEDGQPIRTTEDPVRTFDYQFEYGMQSTRKSLKMETASLAEKEALLAIMRPMLAYRPEERCDVGEILNSEWMTRYAMPDYKRMREGDGLSTWNIQYSLQGDGKSERVKE